MGTLRYIVKSPKLSHESLTNADVSKQFSFSKKQPHLFFQLNQVQLLLNRNGLSFCLSQEALSNANAKLNSSTVSWVYGKLWMSRNVGDSSLRVIVLFDVSGDLKFVEALLILGHYSCSPIESLPAFRKRYAVIDVPSPWTYHNTPTFWGHLVKLHQASFPRKRLLRSCNKKTEGIEEKYLQKKMKGVFVY